MGIVAQYAVVFAQAIVDSKSKGVFPFLIEIKDKDYNWKSGIEGGDIGPKIGFHTNENGFLLFNNVRIPTEALITKYV
jgi:acyl-CoA oxidase